MGIDPWVVEESESAKFGAVLLNEIPVPLGDRVVISTGPRTAFWVDGFRGYSDGFTFETHYRWDTTQIPNSNPDAWPDLTATAAEGNPVLISVKVDGRERSNTAHGYGVLHAAGSVGRAGIASATWWVPDLPKDSFTISFDHQATGGCGVIELSVEEWQSQVARWVIGIG